MKKLVAVRLTERQQKQLEELQVFGFGNQSDIIRTAIDRMHQQEVRETRWEKEYRHNLINDFDEMNIGDLPDIYDMETAKIESMVSELEEAIEAGEVTVVSPDLEIRKAATS